MPKSKYHINQLNFSTKTILSQTQDIIMSKVNRRKKGVYGSLGNRKTIIFIDNLNAPLPEKFSAKPPLELIRNLIDHGRIYNK